MSSTKFDDIAKLVKDALEEDYVTAGCQFKLKKKTGDTAIEAVVNHGSTPGYVKLKLPKPFGISAFNIDKFEFKDSGKIRVETSSTWAQKHVPGLTIESKKDADNVFDALLNKLDSIPESLSVGFTYTGLADTQIKAETKLADVNQFTAEVMRNVKNSKVGVKFNSTNNPDLAFSHTQGNAFVALVAKQCVNVRLNAAYKIEGKTNLAAACNVHGAGQGQFTVGVERQLGEGLTLKTKIEQDRSLTASLKRQAGGVSLLGGVKVSDSGKSCAYGFQCIVE